MMHAQPHQLSNDLVWYASYGSNLSIDRFMTYIEGGVAPGSLRSQPGARNATPPRHIMPFTLPYSLYFAGESSFWTGGMGFLDHTAVGATLARAYLITREQFIDVVTQENHLTDPVQIDFDTAINDGTSRIQPTSPYGLLLHAGHRDNYPVFTFTSEQPGQTRTVPSARYLDTIAQGLMQTHKLTTDEAHAYLRSFITQPAAIS